MVRILIFQFQIRASIVEANFYGFMPWVFVLKVTLPLALFFHFHSMVLLSQLFKEIYLTKEKAEEIVPTSNLINTSDVTINLNTCDVTNGIRRKSLKKEVQFEEMEEPFFSRKMKR